MSKSRDLKHPASLAQTPAFFDANVLFALQFVSGAIESHRTGAEKDIPAHSWNGCI